MWGTRGSIETPLICKRIDPKESRLTDAKQHRSLCENVVFAWGPHKGKGKFKMNPSVACNTGDLLMDLDENDVYKTRLHKPWNQMWLPASFTSHLCFTFFIFEMGIVTSPISWCCCGRKAWLTLSTAPAYSKRSINNTSEFGIDIYTLLNTKQTNKNLLYSTRN